MGLQTAIAAVLLEMGVFPMETYVKIPHIAINNKK